MTFDFGQGDPGKGSCGQPADVLCNLGFVTSMIFLFREHTGNISSIVANSRLRVKTCK